MYASFGSALKGFLLCEPYRPNLPVDAHHYNKSLDFDVLICHGLTERTLAQPQVTSREIDLRHASLPREASDTWPSAGTRTRAHTFCTSWRTGETIASADSTAQSKSGERSVAQRQPPRRSLLHARRCKSAADIPRERIEAIRIRVPLSISCPN